MNGPGKVVTPAETNKFADWRDFHREGEEKHFTYNPAARDITAQSGEFDEDYKANPPEKM